MRKLFLFSIMTLSFGVSSKEICYITFEDPQTYKITTLTCEKYLEDWDPTYLFKKAKDSSYTPPQGIKNYVINLSKNKTPLNMVTIKKETLNEEGIDINLTELTNKYRKKIRNIKIKKVENHKKIKPNFTECELLDEFVENEKEIIYRPSYTFSFNKSRTSKTCYMHISCQTSDQEDKSVVISPATCFADSNSLCPEPLDCATRFEMLKNKLKENRKKRSKRSKLFKKKRVNAIPFSQLGP